MTKAQAALIALFVVLGALGVLWIYTWLVEVYAPSIHFVT